jgi:hypothetical protein
MVRRPTIVLEGTVNARRPSVVALALAILLLTALAAGAVVAAPAAAAPSGATMSLSALQALLDTSPTGTVDAHFKTVLKGTTISDITCTVQGIAPGQAEDGGPLIVFTSIDPVIDQLGGIAAGMSGSPVYVNDGGDKLIGAVSYGAYTAGGGFGMATPIERMTTLEDFMSSDLTVRRLDAPVKTNAGLVDRVVVARSRAAAAKVDPRPGTIVVAPMTELQVTGIPADSRMFRTLQHLMADRGVDLRCRMLAAPTGAAAATPPALDPGASVAAMLTRGDPVGPDDWDDAIWYYGVGGVGTVTYTTTDGGLVAWGHPFLGGGQSGMYMNDANVLTTVPSITEPFKVAVPGVTPRGTFTQDGLTGIAGLVGSLPAEVPISVHAVDSATGKTVDTTSYVTRWTASQPTMAGLTPAAVWPALWQASGDTSYEGTIDYSYEIDVSEGADQYVVQRSGSWDSGWDAATLVYLEMALDMMRLTGNVDGIAAPVIESISVEATLSRVRNRARIADISVPGGLKVGENTVHVTMWPYGSMDAKTVDVPLTIEPGTMLSGTLYATAPWVGLADAGGGWVEYEDPIDPNPAERQTLDKIVAGINARPSTKQIQVAYDPDNDEDWSDWNVEWGDAATVTMADAATYVVGSKDKATTRLRLDAMPSRVASGARVFLRGTLSHAAADTTVDVYMRKSGTATDTLLEEDVPVVLEPGEGPWMPDRYVFMVRTPRLRHATVFTAVWGGDSKYLGATGKRTVKVSAR